MEKILGICLSGGGARGAAHIGVLRALLEHGIEPYYVSGASAGSIVGALYAAGIAPEDIWKIIDETKIFSVLKVNLGSGIMDLSNIQKVLAKYIPEDRFEALQRKLFVCVTNLHSGDWEIKESGPVYRCVEASSAIPMVFKPVWIGDHQYIDGGVLNNLPIEPLKQYCDLIIGVDVMPGQIIEKASGIVQVAQRSMDIIIHANTKSRLAQCDIKLEIEGIQQYAVHSVDDMEAMYVLGYEYALKEMNAIKNIITS